MLHPRAQILVNCEQAPSSQPPLPRRTKRSASTGPRENASSFRGKVWSEHGLNDLRFWKYSLKAQLHKGFSGPVWQDVVDRNKDAETVYYTPTCRCLTIVFDVARIINSLFYIYAFGPFAPWAVQNHTHNNTLNTKSLQLLNIKVRLDRRRGE